MWRDEAFNAVVVSRPVNAMIHAVAHDSAPPLPYLAEHVIAALWPGPAGLRLLSAIFGALAVPVGAALGKRIAGERSGYFAAIFCAVAPALVLSSLDARMYAVATTLVMLSALLLWRAVERPSVLRFLLYGASLVLALYTDYFAILAIPAQILATIFVLRAGRIISTTVVITSALAFAALLPWLVLAPGQFSHGGQYFWVEPVGLKTIFGTVVQFWSGPPVDPWVPLRLLLQFCQGLAVAAGVVATIVLIWRRRDFDAAAKRSIYFCLWCGGALLLLFPLSLWHPLVEARYASVVWGPLFPVIGVGFTFIPWRRLWIACIAGTLCGTFALSFGATHPATRSAVVWLQARTGAHDLVDAYPSQYLLLLYYAPQELLERTRVVQSDVPWFWGTAAYQPGVIQNQIPADVTQNRGTIYYLRQPDEPPAILLPAAYRLTGSQCWDGVCADIYRAG